MWCSHAFHTEYSERLSMQDHRRRFSSAVSRTCPSCHARYDINDTPGFDRVDVVPVPRRVVSEVRRYVPSMMRRVPRGQSPDQPRFYVFRGIPTLNNGRPTLKLPPHFTSGGCRQKCLPCDKDGNIAALAAKYPARDRLISDGCRKLAPENVP